MSSSKDEKKKRAYEIFSILKKEYPNAGPLLHYSGPFELLVATILAAQCTDERVNSVTPKLFIRYPDPRAMAAAPLSHLEEIIRSTGFFKNKAQSLKSASQAIMERFGGVFPHMIEDLVSLPGVGRKTANVVVGNCFNQPAIIVDTHMKRVSERLDLSTSKDPDKIEMELRDIIDTTDQTRFSHVVNFHGRYTCQAKKPLCGRCKIERLCPYPDKLF
jgi:endonuclease-3